MQAHLNRTTDLSLNNHNTSFRFNISLESTLYGIQGGEGATEGPHPVAYCFPMVLHARLYLG